MTLDQDQRYIAPDALTAVAGRKLFLMAFAYSVLYRLRR
jgi:hypothetical protein